MQLVYLLCMLSHIAMPHSQPATTQLFNTQVLIIAMPELKLVMV